MRSHLCSSTCFKYFKSLVFNVSSCLVALYRPRERQSDTVKCFSRFRLFKGVCLQWLSSDNELSGAACFYFWLLFSWVFLWKAPFHAWITDWVMGKSVVWLLYAHVVICVPSPEFVLAGGVLHDRGLKVMEHFVLLLCTISTPTDLDFCSVVHCICQRAVIVSWIRQRGVKI